jgi:acyl-[acyl-carrier-protein]-phospholipid O-acyltransferase/long-chain-fatty-acid--[acyl-carrier-protein] ligase
MANFFPRSYVVWFLALPATALARLLYRVRSRGAEQLPPGGALLVANHLSYADVLVLQLACPRPIRFVGHGNLPERSPFLRWVFGVAGVIPVSPANALQTTRRVAAALTAGELVLIFAEGSISRTGQLLKIERGFELMARKAGVPVVPVVHDGLWGSALSFAGGRLFGRWPRLARTAVFVAWGRPIPAAQADATTVRQAMLDLGHEAMEERPELKRHLGREIVRQLARRPGRVTLVDRTAERRELTAAALFAAAAALSRRLRATVPERRVGLVLPTGAGATLANLAVLFAGKVPVNLNFTAGRAAIESSLRTAEIATVITAAAFKDKFPDFPWPERTLDLKAELDAAGAGSGLVLWFLAAWLLPGRACAALLGLPTRGESDEAGLLFTSGSSGGPKGVALTHRNLLGNCAQVSSLSILPPSARMLACLPVFHSFGFTVTLWYPLLQGCSVVTLPSPLDSRGIAAAIREEECTVLVGAPTFLRPLLRRAEPRDLRTLHLVVSGAEKLPPDLAAGFREKFHLEIMQGYGLTETSPASSLNQPDILPPEGVATTERQPGQRAGSVGRPVPGMAARVLDPATRAELPLTATGLIALRGPNIFAGYLGDEAKTRAAFHDGWFITGDLGRFDDDGFLWIEGRLSRFSKIGGEMVPHGTVEAALVKAFAIDPMEGYTVVVTGVPDPGKGEALVLLTTHDLTADAVREKLAAAGLTNLWIPRTVRRVEKIPVLGTGKLDLKACQELAAQTGETKPQ